MAGTLTGTVERVTFHKPDKGYAVTCGRCGVATVVCRLLAVTAGELIEAEGRWVIDP